MKPTAKSVTEKCPDPTRADPNAICSECGVYGAHDFGGLLLCTNCYAEKGSCCPEFGKDDLWRKAELP